MNTWLDWARVWVGRHCQRRLTWHSPAPSRRLVRAGSGQRGRSCSWNGDAEVPNSMSLGLLDRREGTGSQPDGGVASNQRAAVTNHDGAGSVPRAWQRFSESPPPPASAAGHATAKRDVLRYGPPSPPPPPGQVERAVCCWCVAAISPCHSSSLVIVGGWEDRAQCEITCGHASLGC